MKLLTSFAAIIAAAAAGRIYSSQPSEAYAHSAEVYQSALEYQQQGLYSDQSQAVSAEHGYAGHEEGQSQAYSGHARTGEMTARILSYESERDGHGYHYSFETDNGIKTQEAGQILGHEKGTEAQGSFSYKGDDGNIYTVTYTADENGFRPQGAHLPTPPPIPEAIAKSLEQNAKDEKAGIFDDGKYTEHQSHQEPNEHHHEVSSGHQQAAQAFQYETAAYQHEFQPSQGHQAYQHYQPGHQSVGHQPTQHHQLSHQTSGGHQTSHYQIGLQSVSGGHQAPQVHQIGHQSVSAGHQAQQHQFGHQSTSGGHGDGLIALVTGQFGHQGQSYQGHQPSGFQPSYHMTVPVEGYKKH